MTTMQDLSASQASPEVIINENFDSLSAAAIFSKNPETTSGLVWGYYGGLYNGNTIGNGTVTLTNTSDNYVVVLRSTGVVSTSTSSTNSLNTLYAKLYKVTCAGGVATTVVDQRLAANGLLFGGGSAGDVVGPSSSTNNNLAQFDGTTGKLLEDSTVAFSTDGTFASNSDAKLPTEKAVKTYVATVTAASLQGTGLDVDAAGFRGIPQNSQSGNYTTLASDAGKHLLHPSGAGSGDTFTIDSNTNVTFEIGTAITFINLDSNSLSIAITSDTMTWASGGGSGTRALAQYGIATAVKVGTTQWLISGTGLS